MSEQNETDLTTPHLNGWVKLYLKGSPDVLVTLPVAGETAEEMAEATRAYLNYFQATNPGLEPDQMKTVIVGCIRFIQPGDRGDTEAVHLYREYFGKENTEFKTQTVYFDERYPQRRAAFERASGLKLAEMPLWEGESPPTWKARADVLQKYMRAPVTPLILVQKPNPQHNPDTEEGKKKPARMFVGFLHDGEVIGGYDDVIEQSREPVAVESTAKSKPDGAKATPKSTPKRSSSDADREKLTFRAVRVDSALRTDGKSRVLRFFSSFDETPTHSAISFTREPIKGLAGYVVGEDSLALYDALATPGSYILNRVVIIHAEKHTSKDDSNLSYWLVASAEATNEAVDIPF